ncbi:NKAP domain containing 1 [Lampris incognitus]|uniref:NKAP domain containing 1 n=1 Tax=Lampris incognitus TaxID=2546036 RepID=UPI0024B62CD5|nr:NKAP domain containing 1 [Lampris incognitus]
MSKVPLGKRLLWNVIRHTDAHNKIQEESEMWKMRVWEKQTSHQKQMPSTEFMRGHMHCDRVENYSGEQAQSKDRTSGHDDRDARYWSRKLYEFEANDPDRWGHSGFKELYPEEFESDSEEATDTKNGHHKMKKSKSSMKTAASKRSKKSSQKKKRKKKKKKHKGEKGDGKPRRVEGASSESGGEESSDSRRKQRRRTKSKHRDRKGGRKRRKEEDGDDAGERERKTHSRRKRKLDSHKDSESGTDTHRKKRRKNWKVANEENSDDSSGD